MANAYCGERASNVASDDLTRASGLCGAKATQCSDHYAASFYAQCGNFHSYVRSYASCDEHTSAVRHFVSHAQLHVTA